MGARIAENDRHLQRSREHATSAMAEVEHVDRRLHPSAARPVAAELAGGTGSGHLSEVMEHELAAHLRA